MEHPNLPAGFIDIQKSNTIVLAFGTFDKFHPGHEHYLRFAKSLGDFLFVIVARDKNVEKLKGKLPVYTELERLQRIQAFDAVDHATLGFENWNKHNDITTLVKPNIICLGYDQAIGYKAPSEDIQVVRAEAYKPEIYKSSLL